MQDAVVAERTLSGARVRTWLYRVATTRCLNAAGSGRALPVAQWVAARRAADQAKVALLLPRSDSLRQIAVHFDPDGTAPAHGAQRWPSTMRAVLRHKATDRLLMLAM